MQNNNNRVRRRPGDSCVDAVLRKGMSRMSRGDYAGAVAQLDRAISAGPDDAQAILCRGEAKSKLDDHAGALADLLRANDVVVRKMGNPESPGIFGMIAETRMNLGDVEGAAADLEHAATLPGSFAERLHVIKSLGRMRYALGDHAGAAVALVSADALAPGDVDVLSTLSDCKTALGDHAGALAVVERLLKLEPGSAAFLSRRAELRAWTGDSQGALADLDGADAISPIGASVLHVRGLLKWKGGDLAGALADFERCDRLGGLATCTCDDGVCQLEHETKVLKLIGSLRLRLGDYAGALAVLERAEAIDPADKVTISQVVEAHAKLGDLAGALAALQRSVSPENADQRTNLSVWAPTTAADKASLLTRILQSVTRASSGEAEASDVMFDIQLTAILSNPGVPVAEPAAVPAAVPVAEPVPARPPCAACGAAVPRGKNICPCSTARYCNRECQIADWPRHKAAHFDKLRSERREAKAAMRSTPCASLACGAHLPPGEVARFCPCIGARYCGRECQLADWKRHRAAHFRKEGAKATACPCCASA